MKKNALQRKPSTTEIRPASAREASSPCKGSPLTAAGSVPAHRRRLLGGLTVALVLLVGGLFAFFLAPASEPEDIMAWFGAPDDAASEPEDGMVWIPGGEFVMGDERFPDALPLHKVQVDGFWMDKTEVTNIHFARFVKATGYKTIAERQPDARDYPGAPREKLVPGSGVFAPPPGLTAMQCREGNCCPWWVYTPGACWKYPEGPGITIKGKADHPVVHIAWDDAVAYCKWANKRLPTEAEWEFAARGGLAGKPYYWGDKLKPDGKWMANIWQGDFPNRNTVEDGYRTTAPVGIYPANPYGLHDMSGNVWEWCNDWYRPDYYKSSPKENPQGPNSSVDPDGQGQPKRVMRGGSFLCSDQYCNRYLAGARHQGAPDTGLMHNGFRCVKSR